jgi:hypothetical protein
MSRTRPGSGRGLAALGEIVSRVYPSAQADELRLVRASAWWERHAPPRVARNARPARLRRGVLVFHAATSAWAQELQLLLPQLAPALARAVPGIDARRVRVHVGPVPPRPTPPSPPPPAAPPLSLGELPDPVARALAAIADDRLRDAIARAAAQSLAPRRTPRRTGARTR